MRVWPLKDTGGVMEIQKEREAFECEFKQTDYYIAHGDLSTLMLCDDQYALDDVQVSFEMWKAAKARAVPEGFVLVPKEPSADLVNHGHQVFLGHFNEGGQTGGRSIYFAYKAMIEAQEQSHEH